MDQGIHSRVYAQKCAKQLHTQTNDSLPVSQMRAAASTHYHQRIVDNNQLNKPAIQLRDIGTWKPLHPQGMWIWQKICISVLCGLVG